MEARSSLGFVVVDEFGVLVSGDAIISNESERRAAVVAYRIRWENDVILCFRFIIELLVIELRKNLSSPIQKKFQRKIHRYCVITNDSYGAIFN